MFASCEVSLKKDLTFEYNLVYSMLHKLYDFNLICNKVFTNILGRKETELNLYTT